MRGVGRACGPFAGAGRRAAGGGGWVGLCAGSVGLRLCRCRSLCCVVVAVLWWVGLLLGVAGLRARAWLPLCWLVGFVGLLGGVGLGGCGGGLVGLCCVFGVWGVVVLGAVVVLGFAVAVVLGVLGVVGWLLAPPLVPLPFFASLFWDLRWGPTPRVRPLPSAIGPVPFARGWGRRLRLLRLTRVWCPSELRPLGRWSGPGPPGGRAQMAPLLLPLLLRLVQPAGVVDRCERP